MQHRATSTIVTTGKILNAKRDDVDGGSTTSITGELALVSDGRGAAGKDSVSIDKNLSMSLCCFRVFSWPTRNVSLCIQNVTKSGNKQFCEGRA